MVATKPPVDSNEKPKDETTTTTATTRRDTQDHNDNAGSQPTDGRTALVDQATRPGDTSALETVRQFRGVMDNAREQTKAPTLDRKTLEGLADDLHGALTRTKWFGTCDDPDKEKIFRLITPMTEADRRALEQVYEEKFGDKSKAQRYAGANADRSGIVDHTSEFHDSILRETLRDKLGGDNGEDYRKAESIMNRGEGTNDAGALMVAITQTKHDAERGNVAIRAVFETLNSKQIAELEANFQRDYGKTWQQALGDAGDKVTPQTKQALDILHAGTDKKTPEMVRQLAQLAVDSKDARLFGEALRGDSDESKAARQAMIQDREFMAKAINAFPNDMAQMVGPRNVEKWVKSADANGNIDTGGGQKINVLDLIDPVGKDYLQEGRISLATITTKNTDRWIFDNKENIELAARNASDSERKQFNMGRDLVTQNREPANDEERAARDYYKKMHDVFNDKGNDREASMWEAQLSLGRESIISDMAHTHSNGWNFGLFTLGDGHNRQDIMSKAENLSEDDWKLLKDPAKGAAFRQQIEDSLKTYCDEGERTRIMQMLDAKTAKGTFAESKTVHRSLTETIDDNKGHDFLFIGTSYNAKNILDNLSMMTPEDAAKYKSDADFRAKVDHFIKDDSEFSDVEKLYAQRMLSHVAETGQPPKPDAIDNLLARAANDAKPQELIDLSQKVLAADPALRERLSQPDDKLSEQDRVLKHVIQDNYLSAMYQNMPYDQYDTNTARNVQEFIRTGQLSLGDKLSLGFDHKTMIAEVASAPADERAKVRDRFSADEQRIIDSAAANGGKLTLADRVRMLDLGMGNYQDFRAELEKMHNDKDGFVALQGAKDEFRAKYGKDFDDVFLQKVDKKEQDQYKDLLTPAHTDGRQTFYNNVWKALQSDSGWTVDGSGMTMQKSIDQTASALEEYQKVYKTLPEDKQKALDEYFNQAWEQHKQSKEKLAEIVVTATITAAALAAAPFSGGASLAALAAYASIAAAGGAAFTVAAKRAITGNDYDSDHIVSDLVHGAVSGGLIFAIPPAGRVTGLFTAGARTVMTDASVLAASGTLQAAERAAVEKALAETLMQTGKNFGEKEALAVVQRAVPGLEEQAQQRLAQQLVDGVSRNYDGAISQGVAALQKEAEDAAKTTAGQVFRRQVGESVAIGASGNAVATIADAPFNPNGLDAQSLLTNTLVGAAVGAVIPVGFKAFQSGREYLLSVSKEVNATTGATEAVVHAAAPGEPEVRIRRGDQEIVVRERETLRDGDQIVGGPSRPTGGLADRNQLRRTADGGYENASGQRVNDRGELIDQHGRRINERGQLVNERGQAVDERGRPVNDRNRIVNERGQELNEQGQIIDSRGTPIEREFPSYPRSEYDRVRPEIKQELDQWLSVTGKPIGKEFDALADRLGMTEAEKNQILDGLTTVREHGARMRDIDPEQEINWNHTQREFGAVIEYANIMKLSKQETQDLMFAAMFSDGLKTKFNFTAHAEDGALALQRFAEQHLKDISPERIAKMQRLILEHQLAPPEFMAMIYGGAIKGSFKDIPMTQEQQAALGRLLEKMKNPRGFANQSPDNLVDVPWPPGAKALKLDEEELALLRRVGRDHLYYGEGNVIDPDGWDNYMGPGGLSKIIGLRGPGKIPIFQDKHIFFADPENPSAISSLDSFNQSRADFLGTKTPGYEGIASPQMRELATQQQERLAQQIENAKQRTQAWIDSPQGRTELGLPSVEEVPHIDKMPGFTGTREHPDLVDYEHSTPEELARYRKVWDKFRDEVGLEQRVDLTPPGEYRPKFQFNERGQRIDEKGRVINERGKLVNERGQEINEQGQIIDSRGTPIETEFPEYPPTEFERVRPQVKQELDKWLSVTGKPIGKEFDALADRLGMTEAEKNQILDGLTTVREHGARMKGIDPEQEINWNHTQREFGAVIEYANIMKLSKEETQDLMFAAMFSDGLKTKFNFTAHAEDGALALQRFAEQHLKDISPERIAKMQRLILEHQLAPPEFMAMIYGGAIKGSFKDVPMTQEQQAALGRLLEKMKNPRGFANQSPDNLVDVPWPPGAKALKLDKEELALLRRVGRDHLYYGEGNVIDPDGMDNYMGPGGLSKIIGLRGPGKIPIFQDKHIFFADPENPSAISSLDSFNQSRADFLGEKTPGYDGIASPQVRQLAGQQQQRLQQQIENAKQRVQSWIDSPAGRVELGLPSVDEVPHIDKMPGFTGTREHPDLVDYEHSTPEELARYRKVWDRFRDEVGLEQRVDLQPTATYDPAMRTQSELAGGAN